MDFQSAMETFAEAWVAATNAGAAAQTQALALTRPKSESVLSLQNDSASSSGNSGNKDIIYERQSQQQIQQQQQSTQKQQTLAQQERASPLNCENKAPNVDHIKNQLINFGSHEKLTHNDELKQRKSSSTNQQSNASEIGVSPKTNCFNLLGASVQSETALASSDDNTISGGSGNGNNQQLTTGNCPPTTPLAAISSATSPLIDGQNGTTAAAAAAVAAAYMQDKYLPSSTTSPSDLRKEFDAKVNVKSLPLHCIVESITSMQASLCMENRNPWKRRPNIETDSYVIVPAVTPFADILGTALQRLGYSSDIAATARGSIIIKNWKPLPMEKISDNPLVSVGDILGELTSVVTLRIVILRTKPSTFTEIKDKLLKLLILQSHAVLRSAGCPLDEITLSQICRTNYQGPFPYANEISEETCRAFDQWWNNQLAPQASAATQKLLPFINAQKGNVDADFQMLSNRNIQSSRESLLENHKTSLHQSQHHHNNFIVHPALQTVHSQYSNQKTRMRTSFDPEMELPKLQRWFQENPHPSRQQIQSYVVQLNSLDSRRGRKPLDVNNVVYWFKNARAAQKRAELRGQGVGNGFTGTNQNETLHAHNNEYMKSPQSIKSDDIDNMSQHSDDMDDDLERAASPQLPLSLTTHERRRSTSSIEDNQIKSETIDFPIRSPLQNNNNIRNAINNNNGHNELVEHDRYNDNRTLSVVEGTLPPNRLDDSNADNVSDRSQRRNSIKDSPQSEEDLDMEESDVNPMEEYRSPSPSFPILPNSMFSHSIMYMSHYIPQIGQGTVPNSLLPNPSPNSLGQSGVCGLNLSNDERRKRNRTFIDPVTEVPKLEQWFAMNTHPSHNLILKYTEDLNRMPYRQKFPRLESKNVQFWFKNRRAKCKRLKMSLYDSTHIPDLGPFSHSLKRD
ncbi:uncharacterized protein LOC116338969 isoform X2 [Contarinia nasturtii]|uniref:uncharacterized protein LOC116338969 isoform X2 n=1 Tax=Contarinia nasturtii TaxID=265458 RepID=UPI0012D4B008|nr:uncharacterized protein LOC116338969 isoform X2 [Contarinia nasturtii]